jgi:hypothetical protein
MQTSFITKYVQELGYKGLNWNLGCPYQQMRYRFQTDPCSKNQQILHKVHNESDILVSI